jgi:hypothetical protein
VTAAWRDSKLLAELLPMPAGATRPRKAPRPRAYSLSTFVARLYGDDKSPETGYLSALCFETAVGGEWQTHSGKLVAIYLIQFARQAEARSYALGLKQADIGSVGVHGRHARVRDLQDGMIVQDSQLDTYGNTLTRLIGSVGNIAILIHVFVPALLERESALAATASAGPQGLALG